MGGDGRAGVVLDCDEGRRRGCHTFCCRLIVRLDDDEVRYDAQGRGKSCVDKDPSTGLCVHLDAESERCAIWPERPRACRDFDCNGHPLLGVVLRDGISDLASLVRAPPAEERPRRVPKRRGTP